MHNPEPAFGKAEHEMLAFRVTYGPASVDLAFLRPVLVDERFGQPVVAVPPQHMVPAEDRQPPLHVLHELVRCDLLWNRKPLALAPDFGS